PTRPGSATTASCACSSWPCSTCSASAPEARPADAAPAGRTDRCSACTCPAYVWHVHAEHNLVRSCPSASSSVAPRTASSASTTLEGSQMTTPVLAIDASTQATKSLLVDAAPGEVLEERRAAHPDGTEVDPRAWLAAADEAAGPLLERAEAVAVGGQQHGMVLLDTHGEVVRDALLWNDTRSAPQAEALIEEMGGAEVSVEEI